VAPVASPPLVAELGRNARGAEHALTIA
jgi:hypothetical protein